MSFDIPLADQMRIALSYVKFKTRQSRLRSDDKVIVDTTYGKVKGVKWQSIYGRKTYYSFEGIPFAKPPLGKLRFKAPEEPEPWTDVKRCTSVKPKPAQWNIIINQFQGSEDCLYLNVYTRNLNPQKPMPVLVWIFGGAFQMGEASREIYSPDYMMMENVVLISISYRLGPFGFLSLCDEELDVPGNAGLKDQVLALRWVSKNVHFFGGDANNITVFGESAGGAATHYMMLTEQTRGLFHKGVLMSGCAMNEWANVPQRQWGYRLAQRMGYKGEDNDRLVLDYLRKAKPRKMIKNIYDLLTPEERHERLQFPFSPCVEPYLSKHTVIPKLPKLMLREAWSNNIPMLIGGNSFEGLLLFPEVRKFPDLFNFGNCEHLAVNDANLSAEQRQQFGQQLKQAYLGDSEPNWKTILMYSDLFSYKYFWHGLHRTILSRQHYASAPTYVYRFDFDSKHFNFMRIIMCGRKVRGTCHGDELCYLFYNAGAKKLKHRTAEYRTIRRFVSIFVQFAERGDPNIPLSDDATMSLAITHNPRKSDDSGIAAVTDDDELDKQQTLLLPAAPAAQHWQPVAMGETVYKCLNISDELEVIDLPEAEKLKLWDAMYADKSLLY